MPDNEIIIGDVQTAYHFSPDGGNEDDKNGVVVAVYPVLSTAGICPICEREQRLYLLHPGAQAICMRCVRAYLLICVEALPASIVEAAKKMQKKRKPA